MALSFWGFLLITSVILPVFGQPRYVMSSARLLTKNLQEMDQWLRARLTQAQKDSDLAVTFGVEAVQGLMSRPDLDNAIEKLLPQVLYQLESLGITKPVMENFVDDALLAVTQPKGPLAADVRATYFIGLENWLVQLKPYGRAFGLKPLYEKIAHTQIPKDTEAFRWAFESFGYEIKDVKSLALRILEQWDEPVTLLPKGLIQVDESESHRLWQTIELRPKGSSKAESKETPEKPPKSEETSTQVP